MQITDIDLFIGMDPLTSLQESSENQTCDVTQPRVNFYLNHSIVMMNLDKPCANF